MGSSYVPLPGDPTSPSLLQWAQWLREDRSRQKDGAVLTQPGTGADQGQRMSGEGWPAILQGSRRNLPPLGQECGLRPLVSPLTYPGHCLLWSGEGGVGWAGLPRTRLVPRHTVSSAGVLISGHHCCSWGYSNGLPPSSWMTSCPCSAASATPRQSSMPTPAASARSHASTCGSE